VIQEEKQADEAYAEQREQAENIERSSLVSETTTRWAKWAQRLWTEMHAQKSESALYRRARRHVLRMQPIEVARASDRSDTTYAASLSTSPASLRRGGTYLITGGLGGLGYLFAEHLATRYAANLILVGRSNLDASKETQLQALAALGGHAIYIAVEVSDREQLRAALEQGHERFGALHGVIHAAGIEGRTSVLGTDIHQFNTVLAPKITGTLVLNELCADHALDFMCYFS